MSYHPNLYIGRHSRQAIMSFADIKDSNLYDIISILITPMWPLDLDTDKRRMSSQESKIE